MDEIKQKWYLPKYNLSITDDMKVLTKDLVPCVEVIHQGQIKFRIPKTNKRVSRKYIRKNCILQHKILKHIIPF